MITERYSFGWRISLSISVLFSSVLALGALFLSETPRYRSTVKHAFCGGIISQHITFRFLVKKHKDAKALKVLTKIHRDESKAQKELTEIQLSVKSSKKQTNSYETLKYFCSGSVIQR